MPSSSAIEVRPVHEQLLDLYQRKLAAGRWAAGQPFPSERDLAQTHNVSRATANKVLARLRSEGWIENRRGVGSFVADRPTVFASLRQFESFTHFASQIGLHPETRVVGFSIQGHPPEQVVKSLDLRAGQPALCVERIRMLDGIAVIHEVRWLCRDAYPGLSKKDLAGSFYQLCRERYRIEAASESLAFRPAMPPQCSVLDWNVPCLLVEGVARSTVGRPLWFQQLSYAGDCFELLSEVSPGEPFPKTRIAFRGLPSRTTDPTRSGHLAVAAALPHQRPT